MTNSHRILIGLTLLLAGPAVLAAAGQGPPAPAVPSVPAEEIDWAREQQFWSFRKPVAHPLPAVKDKRWVRQPLDAFILHGLERAGLSPSPEAGRRTLIRRVTFDLTGLPPTIGEMEAFLQDRRPDAYERVVDRLLASPRFGERMASLWLPLARYAGDQAHQVGDDTSLFYPYAHKYRDWVIAAFNRDLPYDQFIRLQLAADRVTPAGKSEDLAALGFVGLGPKYYDRDRLEVMADEWEDRVDTVSRTFMGLTVSCARCHDHKFDPVTAKDYYAIAGVFASTKTVNRLPDGSVAKDNISAAKMDPGTLHVVLDDAPKNLNVFLRGNPEQKGPLVERRFLRVLSAGEPAPFKEGSGRRELAEAIASPENPLTARVMANRLWGQMFGAPLVATPSNFGRTGAKPTHPELLDHLALRFVENGWSVKRLLREIALSAAYRQGSGTDAKKAAIDAPNALLWRMNRRRASVEQWRDSVLYVTGELKWDGPPSQDLNDAANVRRTVCASVSRLQLNDMLALFDYPDANVHAEKRSVTSTPMQKLFMMNSPFMLVRAKALAARLTSVPGEENASRVRRAYRTLFSREPEAEETRIAVSFLQKPGAPEADRWKQYAQALLASNEMLFID